MVAFDAVGPSSAGSGNTSATTLTWNHTCAASATYLLVGCSLGANPDTGLSMTATYNGVSMTPVGSPVHCQTSLGFLQVWAMPNPPTGSALAVLITASGGTPLSLSGGSLSFTAAGALGTPVTNTGVSATPTASVPTTSASTMVAAFCANGSGITSATAPLTSRYIINEAVNSSAGNQAGATAPGTGSNVTTAWSVTSDGWAVIAVEVQGTPPAPLDTSRPPNPPGWWPGADAVTTNPGGVPFFLAPVPSAAPPAAAPPYITQILGTGTAQYWADQYGNPVQLRFDTGWAIAFNAGLSPASNGDWHYDIQQYVATRQRQGFNGFLFAAVGTSQIGTTDNGNSWDGIAPFTSPGVLNETYWTRVDYVVQTAANYGLTVIMNPLFSYCVTDAGGAMSTWTAANFTTYGTALGNRYKGAANLLWEFGDDYGGGFDSFLSSCLNAIRAAGDLHLISVENLTPCTSRFMVSNNSVFTWGTGNANWNWCYGYGCAYNAVEYAYKESSPLLVCKMDGFYDTDGVRDYMRWWAWWSLSSGSRGAMYGREAVFKWPAASLAALTTNVVDNSDLGAYWNIFASFKGWHQLVPDTNSVFVTAGRGTRWADTNDAFTTASANTYVTASVTADKTLAVVYNPAANTQTITVAVSSLPAGWAATWVDPVSGATSAAGAGPAYTNAGTNSVGKNDWLLIFQAPAVATPNAASAYAAQPEPPGWFPGAPVVMPGGIPFYVAPVPAYAAVAAAASGPPVYPLHGPVQARRLGQRGGAVIRGAGVYQGTGGAVRPAAGPVQGRQLAARGGHAAGRAGTFTSTAPATGPPVYPLHGPVRAWQLPRRGGHVSRAAGPWDGTGPALKPPPGPVRAQPAARRGGTAQGRAGTFTLVILGAGPPVYPLHGPVQARRLGQRGGSTASRRGVQGVTGPPVRPAAGPVQARQPLPPRGRTASHAGTFTLVVTGSGPPVYPLGRPVTARRFPARGGSASHRAGTYAGTGPAVPALKQPLGIWQRQPPPPARGRVLSLHGTPQGTGPPVPALHQPVRARLPGPVLSGRRRGTEPVAVFIPPPPFTVGTLTASSASLSSLSAASATAGTATLTAADTRTGGPGG